MARGGTSLALEVLELMERFVARQRPDGQSVVLGLDGLTWEPLVHAEYESAVRHADELNRWLDARPTGESPELLLDTFGVAEGDAVAAPLLMTIEKLYSPERRLDYLAMSLGLGLS